MLYVGEGSEREQWHLLHSLPVFSHSLCYPQANWALLVLLPKWVGFVCSRTLWVSPRNSPVRLGVSPTATSTPTVVFNQWFEALFPHARTLGCVVRHPVHQLLLRQPAAALSTQLHNPPPHWVRQSPPCHTSSLPGCLSPPLLPVWMNVSSLSLWLLDFHTV